MTINQQRIAAKQSSDAYQAVKAYAESADMILQRDPVSGYWLKYDGRMRFVPRLSDVRGVVDWINR